MVRKNSTRISLFLFLLILISETSSAQYISITGQVTTADGGAPVFGAAVLLSNTSRGTTTDEMGKFYFNELSQSTYTIVVSHLGYEKFEKEIELTENRKIKISLKKSPINLTEVTVSTNQGNTESEFISGVDKLLRPVNSSQDLLTLVPGLFIAQHAGGGKAEQIFLRGFDADHGTDFNISVDGMPVNMVSHAHGQGYSDFHFVIPETVDRLRVYKGPYTARMGDFATSGAGEFFTKNAIENNVIKVEAGMFDTYRALGMFKLSDNKNLISKENENVFIAGEYVFSNAYFNEKQKLNRYNIFSKYSGMLKKNHFFTLSASTFFARWNASGQIPQRAVDEGIIDRFGSIDPSEGGETGRTNVNSTLTTTTKSNATIKNQVYYVKYDFNLISNFTFYLNDSINGDAINQNDNRNIIGYNGTYQKNFKIADKTLHTTAGVGTRNDFTQIALTHVAKKTVFDTIVSGKVNQQNTHTFVDGTFDINQNFSINSGIRLDYFSFQFNDDNLDSLSGNKEILRASPKLNFYYSVNDNLQFFLKTGIGFHSNDARSVVINQTKNSLPKAYGSEIGSEFKLSKRILFNVALWALYLQSELIYIGDEGTVETSNPTKRLGTDISIRYQITEKFFTDIDFNFNYGRLVSAPKGENYIPLAPHITSIGGLTYTQHKGINSSLRYRFIDSRPANENNTVTALGYLLLDAVVAYKFKKAEVGITAENLLNRKWNQAQFDTESRLLHEAVPVSELHFTPGTPFFLKGNISFHF